MEAESGAGALLNLLRPHVGDREMSLRTTYDLVSAAIRHPTSGHAQLTQRKYPAETLQYAVTQITGCMITSRREEKEEKIGISHPLVIWIIAQGRTNRVT